jgi:hypothetical protein
MLLIFASVYNVKQLLKLYPLIKVNNSQIYLHVLVFSSYTLICILNLKWPSPETFLFNGIAALTAYLYIAVLLYRFAVPIRSFREDQDDDLF